MDGRGSCAVPGRSRRPGSRSAGRQSPMAAGSRARRAARRRRRARVRSDLPASMSPTGLAVRHAVAQPRRDRTRPADGLRRRNGLGQQEPVAVVNLAALSGHGLRSPVLAVGHLRVLRPLDHLHMIRAGPQPHQSHGKYLYSHAYHPYKNLSVNYIFSCVSFVISPLFNKSVPLNNKFEITPVIASSNCFMSAECIRFS